MCGIRGDTADPEGNVNLAGGRQPVANEDGTVRAVLDGEIYNRARLWQLLREHGHTPKTETDAELLVHLYEEYGEDLVHALEGAFGFAIWDSREGVVLVGRDRFGEKPIFYAIRPEGGLAFASELTTLAAGGAVGDELDPLAVDRYFAYGYVPGELSMFAGARRLQPGHLLVWRPGEAPGVRRYWSPPKPTESNAEAEGDLVVEMRRLLTESVRSRLARDAPIGVFLDGGPGSSVVAAIAAAESDTPIEAFSHGDAAVAEAAPVPSILRALDQPSADPSLPALAALAAFAGERVGVALSGTGADELFGGHPRHFSAHPKADEWRLLSGPRRDPEADSGFGRSAQVEKFDLLSGDVLANATGAGIQASLEIRTPYLNHELAEFAATVPPELHASDGGRKLLRALLELLVPKSSRRRPETAPRAPVADWLRGPLAPALRDQLVGSGVAEGWLDGAALAPRIDRHLVGAADESAILWSVLAFGLWLDRVRGRDLGA